MRLVDFSDDVLLEIFKKINDYKSILALREVSTRFKYLVECEPLIKEGSYVLTSEYICPKVLPNNKLAFNICHVYDNIHLIIKSKNHLINRHFKHNIKSINSVVITKECSLEYITEEFPNLKTLNVSNTNRIEINTELTVKELRLESTDCFGVNINQNYIETLKVKTLILQNMIRFNRLRSLTVKKCTCELINKLPDLEFLQFDDLYSEDDEEVIEYRVKNLVCRFFDLNLAKCPNVESLKLCDTEIPFYERMNKIVHLDLCGRFDGGYTNDIVIAELPLLETLSLESHKGVCNQKFIIELYNLPRIKSINIKSYADTSLYIGEIPKSVKHLKMNNVNLINKVFYSRLFSLELIRFDNIDEFAIKSIEKLILIHSYFSIYNTDVKKIAIIGDKSRLVIPFQMYKSDKYKFDCYFDLYIRNNTAVLKIKDFIEKNIIIANIEFVIKYTYRAEEIKFPRY